MSNDSGQAIKERVTLDQLDQRELKRHGKPADKTSSMPLREEDPTKTMQIESLLDKKNERMTYRLPSMQC